MDNAVSSRSVTRHRRRRNDTKLLESLRDPLVAATSIFVVIALICGGGQGQLGISSSLIGASGLAVLLIAVLYGGLAKFGELPTLPRLAVLLAIILPFLQMVPLPPGVWSSLPGHEQRAQVLAEIDLAASWQPLTMAIAGTAYSAMMTLIMFGFLLALLLLQPSDIRRLLVLVVAVIGFASIVGVIQFATNSPLVQFHRIAHRDALIGFFANKNHMALALACIVPIVFELWIRGARAKVRQPTYLGLLAAVLVPLVVATNSRAGLLLVLIALFVCILQIYKGKRWHLTIGLIASVAMIFLLVQLVPNIRDIVDRFGDTQSYGCLEILSNSMPLADRFWMFGAGIGSFPSVYESMEKLTWVFPATVNHAHNDYVEILIEAGLFGVAIVLMAFAALVQAFVAWWNYRSRARGERGEELDFMGAGLSIVALFVLHSFVDYPIRRVATLTLLLIGVALVFRPLSWLRSAS